MPEGVVPVQRKMYEETEVLFVTKNDRIHVIRFGSGDDVTYELKKAEEIL